MKVLSKSVFLLVLPLSLASLFGCNKSIKYYSEIKNPAPYLHEITYENYEEDVNCETLKTKEESNRGFGCTSIRKNNIYGRNFDYFYTNFPQIVVKMKPKEGRYKSIGIAHIRNLFENDLLAKEKEKENQHLINIIPNVTLDGINEHGVICNMNSVDIFDAGGQIKSTNPGKERLHLYFIIRKVLDNAKNADEAIEVFKKYDLYTIDPNEGNFHFMIADPQKTYVIEFYKNNEEEQTSTLLIKEKKEKEQILTNFYTNFTREMIDKTYPIDYKGDKTCHNNASGVERYNYVLDRYKDINNVASMQNILKELKYTNAVSNPNTPIWPSEDYDQMEIYSHKGEEEPQYEFYEEHYQIARFVLDNKRRDLGISTDVWTTRHSSVYDIEKKELYLNAEEDYTNTYSYNLNF